MIRNIALLTLFAALLLACNDSSDNSNDTQIVLMGYLYEDLPVDSIFICRSRLYSSTDTTFPPVTNASVYITCNDKQYQLSNIGNGYYSYTGDDLTITSGIKYSIVVQVGDKTLTASTTVPEKTTGLSISDTLIYIDTSAMPMMGDDDTNIDITWTNSDTSYYFVRIDNVETNPVDIEYSGFEYFDDSKNGERPNFKFRSEPFIESEYTIRGMMSLTQWGRYRVRVYKVNQEYADLYQYRTQDSRNLTEPLTNVTGGLGVFTAFSYADTSFTVEQEE